jgi:penicillin-binding protein 2
MNASTWDSVFEGMYSVVNETGGSVFPLYNNFDITVAGKTGTSQISKVNPNNALFVSFAPYNAPKISVTAVIPNGYTSYNAAELSKDIYKLYFNLEESEELLEGEVSVSDTNNNSVIE